MLGVVDEVAALLPDLAEALRFMDFRGDLERLFPPAPEGIVEDVAPEPPEDPVTKPGDLIVLGSHRLLCGYSADAATLLQIERELGLTPAVRAGLRAEEPYADEPGRANYGFDHFGRGWRKV